MNYEKMLLAYIKMVVDAESVAFFPIGDMASEYGLSKEEFNHIKKLTENAEAEWHTNYFPPDGG